MPAFSEILERLTGLPGLERVVGTTGVRLNAQVATYTGTAATVADTRRVIVSSDLADSGDEEDAQEMASDYFDGSHVYVPSWSVQRRVQRGGFTSGIPASDVMGTTSDEIVGYFTTSARFPAVMPPGLAFGVYKRLPVIGAITTTKTLFGCVNDALDGMTTIKRVSATADGTKTVSLVSLPWLTREDQLGQVLNASSYQQYGNGRIRFDGEIPYLEFDYAIASGTPLTVELYRPRSSWIRVKRTARATATLAAGAVSAFTVQDGGAGYTTAPTITVTGAGTLGTGTATLSGDSIASIAVNTAGSGYGTAPTTVVIGAPTGTWADSTVGLVNYEDECSGPVRTIALCAYFFACDFLALNDPRGELDVWAGRRDRVMDVVAPYLMNLQPESRPVLQPSRAPTELFPGVPGSGGYDNGGSASDWP